MKLTAAIKTLVLTRLSDQTVHEVDRELFQKKILEDACVSEEDFKAVLAVHKRHPGLVGLSAISENGTTSFYYNGVYYKVKLVGDGGHVYLFTCKGYHTVLRSLITLGRDWSVVLGAFTTVESAIEGYPELKSVFEEVLGKKF